METVVKTLVNHLDSRGSVTELLRSDDPCFAGFGQVYVSTINPGVVKGFYKHSKQTGHLTCVRGQIKLVLVEDRPDAAPAIEEHHLSPLSPKLVVLNPGVWYSWKAVGNAPALIVNVIDVPFDRDNPDTETKGPGTGLWNYCWRPLE